MGAHEGKGPEIETQLLAGDGGNIGSPIVSRELAISQVWTKQEFAKAKPYPIEISDDVIRKAKIACELGHDFSIDEGQAGIIQGQSGSAPTATTGGYNYPGPFTRHEVFCPYTQYPYVTIGKLFFKQYGVSYVASAASIGNYAIWTGGHCVHKGDGNAAGWSTNVVFVPAYKDGVAPYGQWPAARLWTRTNWFNNGIPNGLCEDLGGAVLYPNGAGKKISQVVGWLGFAWNYPRYQHWHSLGYPAASPFSGNRLITNQASFAYLESGLGCALKPHAIGCDMTGGCSGGPWIIQFGTNNYVNGHNSYRNTSSPQEMKSPYIGNEAKSLFDILMNATP